MASILRSSKFVRYIAGFARNVVLNTPREFDGNLVNNTQCLCGNLQRPFATQIPATHDQNLERSLKRIDQDVRKSGRISRRDIEDVLEEIRNARSATSSQSLLVIRCCGNLVPEELPEIRTKLVQEIWNTLNKLNVPMDISHYNALLRVYLENEHAFSPTDFLADLESKGLEPNRVTYQRLIARYCQIGDIEGATKILEYMREKQLPVNENVFNALIVGHSQSGDMDSARGILNVMVQAGLEPSADTYTTLLCGYAKKGDIAAIDNILQECEAKEIYLLDKDYLEIIYALTINGHAEHVPNILAKVRKAIGYNQDAINLILRLINKGHEDVSMHIVKSMTRQVRSDGTPQACGLFMIRQMIKANRPFDVVLRICKQIETDGLYDRALLLAAEISLEIGNETLAYPLLEELKRDNLEIRQHYFWPLIVSKANDASGQGIVNVLLQMYNFGITPSTETIREYVIPNMQGKSSRILELLRDANVSLGVAASSLVHVLLQKQEIAEAAIISGNVPAYYNPDQLRRHLTNSFYKTRDLESYVIVLRNIYENLHKKTPEEPDNTVDKTEIIGNFVVDLATNPREFLLVIPDVLKQLVSEGLSISTAAAEKIQDKLGEKMTEEISSQLAKLTSGDLTPLPITRKTPSYIPSSQMNIPQLERLVQNLEAKNQDTKGLKRQLLNLYYRAKDLEKTEQILEDLKQTDFTFTAGIYAQLLDVYAHHDRVDKALEYLEKLRAEEKDDFKLDEIKIIRLVYALIKTGDFTKGLGLLDTIPTENRQEERGYSYNSLVWRMLNHLAEEGRIDDLDTIFNALIEKEFVEINNMLLGPLIKVHLVNGNIDKALEKFEWCVNQYKTTPWKNDLACKLIQAEDAEKLQKLTDLSTAVHGEINSLYDLVFAFVECGRIRQARKILETPGLQTRPQRINSACERYRQEGMVKPLEDLKDATKDLNHIDRTDIYYQLLLSYIKQDDVNKALGLWTQMQEEDLLPTDQFLLKLADFLTVKNVEIPFVVPKTVAKPPPNTIQSNIDFGRNDVQQFRQLLRDNEVLQALKLEKRIANSLSVGEYSLLVEKLLQNDRVNDATQIVMKLLHRHITPIARVFKFYLNKIASVGDIDTLENIGRKITIDVKKFVSFDNRLCHANLVAGRSGEYLDELERKVDEANDDKLKTISEQFPRGGAYGILEKHPELVEKYEKLAIKFVERGYPAPINVLWSHHFIRGNDQKAEELWEKYLKNAPRIMFQRIVQTARDDKDENLVKKLIEHLKISKVTEGAIGNAYSCLLDVLVSKGLDEEVVKSFETALNDCSLDSINRTAVIRVKEVYEKLGKTFSHKIPLRNVKTATTSSSTSDEEGNRRIQQ